MHPRSHALARRLGGLRRPAGGFTLIELLVVIGIISFILSVTILAVSPMFRTAGTQTAAQQVRSALDGAHIRAIQQGRQVRFEAQLVPATTTHAWRLCSDAGSATPEWEKLPDFVALATNAAGSPGADGLGGSYDGSLPQPDTSTRVESISVTFRPDGSVRRFRIGGERQTGSDPEDPSDDTFSTVSGGAEENPTNPFAVRLTSMRDTAGGEPMRRWVVIYPLTGGMQTFESTD